MAAPQIEQGVSQADIDAYGQRCHEKGYEAGIKDALDRVVGSMQRMAIRYEDRAAAARRFAEALETLARLRDLGAVADLSEDAFDSALFDE